PLDLRVENTAAMATFARRVAQWQTKALREAKLHSSWVEPNTRHERESAEFLFRVLGLPLDLLDQQADEAPSRMPESPGLALQIQEFVEQIAPAGALNGLVQTLLRMTSPGVPDLY